jgi:hypothetical protein
LTGRQKVVYGRRLDLLFEDRFKRVLLVELKWGPIQDQHIGQLMSYEGTLLSGDSPDLRVMLIGTRVPPNIRRSLDHHGIAWKEMRPTDILLFLRSKNDSELALAFDDDVSLVPVFASERPSSFRTANSVFGSSLAQGGPPALLGVVQGKWLDQAFEELRKDKEKYFKADSQIGKARHLPIKNVYFKVKGTTAVIARAKFIEVTTVNPPTKRLKGCENDAGKFYYGFRDLVQVPPIQLADLRYFNTKKPIPNAVPRSCIIEDPYQ